MTGKKAAGGGAEASSNSTGSKPLSIAEFQLGIAELKSSMNDTFEDLKSDFGNKIDAVKDYVDSEISRLVSCIEDVEKSHPISKTVNNTSEDSFANYDDCVVVSDLGFDEEEDLPFKIAPLFESMGTGDTVVVSAKRMGRGPTPLVKVALEPHTRDSILRKKGALRRLRGYERVFMRPSKPLWERNMDANMRVLARTLPGYRCALDGRLVQQAEYGPRWNQAGGNGAPVNQASGSGSGAPFSQPGGSAPFNQTGGGAPFSQAGGGASFNQPQESRVMNTYPQDARYSMNNLNLQQQGANGTRLAMIPQAQMQSSESQNQAAQSVNK